MINLQLIILQHLSQSRDLYLSTNLDQIHFRILGFSQKSFHFFFILLRKIKNEEISNLLISFLLNFAHSHSVSAFQSFRNELLKMFKEIIISSDFELTRILQFINHYILTFERFFDSKQKHIDSYMISPIEINFLVNSQNLIRTLRLSLVSQIYQLRLAISSSIGKKPSEFEIYHENHLINDNVQLLESEILQDNKVEIRFQKHEFITLSYSSSLTFSIYTQESAIKLFDKLSNDNLSSILEKEIQTYLQLIPTLPCTLR